MSNTDTPNEAAASEPALYVASKTVHAPMWRQLRTTGPNIISTWIDEAGEGETADYSELSERCLDEIRKSSAVILYCEHDDLLKGALIEVGMALALGKSVYCAGDSKSLSRVFREHPLWIPVESVEAACVAALACAPDPSGAPTSAAESAPIVMHRPTDGIQTRHEKARRVIATAESLAPSSPVAADPHGIQAACNAMGQASREGRIDAAETGTPRCDAIDAERREKYDYRNWDKLFALAVSLERELAQAQAEKERLKEQLESTRRERDIAEADGKQAAKMLKAASGEIFEKLAKLGVKEIASKAAHALPPDVLTSPMPLPDRWDYAEAVIGRAIIEALNTIKS